MKKTKYKIQRYRNRNRYRSCQSQSRITEEFNEINVIENINYLDIQDDLPNDFNKYEREMKEKMIEEGELKKLEETQKRIKKTPVC